MWFSLPSLTELIDAPTFARGLLVFRAQKLRSMAVDPGPSGEIGQWQLTGQVQGTQRQPYQVTVDLHLMPDHSTLERWNSRCTCPVGSRCKHAVALLIKAAHSSPPIQPESPLTPEERQRQQTEAERQRRQAAALQLRMDQTLLAERWLLNADGAASQPTNQEVVAYLGWKPQRQPVQSPMYLLHFASASAVKPVLRLSLGASSIKAKGGWSRPRSATPSHFRSGHAERFNLTDADHDILALLGALPPLSDPFRYGGASEWILDAVAAAIVLQRAATTERLFWRGERDSIGDAMAWGPPLALTWRWDEQASERPEDALWQLVAQLAQPGAVLCGNNPLLYVNVQSQQVGAIEGGADARLQALLHAPALPLHTIEQHPFALMQRLGDAAPLPPVLPEIRRLGGQPVWRLHLSRLDSMDLVDAAPAQALCAQLDFDYQGLQGWWPHGITPLTVEREGGERVVLQRDLASERQASAQLDQLGLELWGDGLFILPVGASQTPWMLWAEAHFQAFKDAGFDVNMDAALQQWVRPAGDLSIAMAPQDSADDGATSPWFDLSLGLEVDGQRINLLPALPQIIADLRQAKDGPETEWPDHIYLPAPDGQGFYRVATAPLKPWLDGLLELFDERAKDFNGDSLRLSRIDALRARVALGEGVAWQGAEGLGQLAEQLRGQTSLPTTPLPAGLKASLRPYQQQGLDWLQFLRGHGLAGILADDMGLGKTLQTLAHLQCEKEAGRLDRPALVIVPVSLLGNWRREAARFCPGLRCVVLHGAERHEQASEIAQADLVIAPYSLLHRDRERWLAQAWHLVVLDEAQNIKNAATQAAQVVNELNTRHRLCLSGTPIENHLGEIWSLFHFLMPGFLGSQVRFAKRFRQPIEKHGDAERMAQLRARLTPFILRRTKDVVADELPPKVETVMPVELGGKQADLYETIRLSMEKAVRQAITDKGLAKSQIAILDALLKLRQVCCDPRLVKTTAAAKVKTSAKLDQLMELLPEMLAEGRKILLFSAFTSMLSLIEDELLKRKIPWVKLTGQTQKRDEVIERFTSGEVPLFLISLKAGGVGLNLPQADTVIHFDPWWNPAAENQATDRAHRIGQTQSVWVIKLVAQGTIEERILALQERKAALARELYSGAAARKQPLFTQDDVQALLRPMD
ncbi:MAG: DEAD/DEAH box helicase [Hydrogenophaga sp.]